MSILVAMFKTLIACVPFAVMLLSVCKLNLKKINRGRQIAMPFVVVGYFLLLVAIALWVNAKIQITMIDTGEKVGCIRFWLGYSISQKVECIQLWLQTRLNSLTNSYDFGSLISLSASVVERLVGIFVRYLMLIINTAVVLGFLVVKGIALPILNAIWGNNSTLEAATVGLFYEYDDLYQVWFLQERWRDFSGLIRAAFLAVFVSSCVLLGLSRTYFEVRVFQSVLAPVLACLLLGELYCLLGGYTQSEYETDIMGEDSKSKQVVNLTKLRDSLKSLFGDRLLLESSALENTGKSGVTDLLSQMEDSTEKVERISARFFQILQAEGVPLDVDNIVSATNLLRHESVLFCNPFYRDLTQYFMLPMTDTLMNRKKCLVIAGRKSTEPEIRKWIEESIQAHLKMSGLWRVGSIGDNDGDFEIGVLSFSQLYNLDMLHGRRDFFHKVGLVLILEPSLILATGQIGLSLVVNYCDEVGEKPVYCMCDRNCDGLVDTLSHMIKQSITIVSATETPTCLHSEMCWHSDGEYMHRKILPDISRYLGVGTELAVASVKEQVPRVVWRSEKKFPVVDMKWIAGQYYGPICQYANLPMNQEAVYQSVGFESDLWGTKKEKYACIIVEDEFCNLLEMVRVFLTRGEEQAFVNVISENYLLRGYMQHNYRIFAADQKAIPTIVTDYARTERNTTIRLIMMLVMSESVSEEMVEKELRLVGIKTNDLCEMVNRLIAKYTLETRPLVTPVLRDSITGLELESGSEAYLQIPKEKKASFLDHIGMSFQTAYYITEDDKEGSSFMDAKLFGHIYQAILPGQFFTYDGKYYEVRSVTPEKGVLVRRAADHIVGRRYYRQKRRYHLPFVDPDSGRSRMVNGIEVAVCSYEISVETDGYFELDESNNIRTAKEILVADNEDQANEHFEYVRNYVHKNALRLRLPDTSEEVRYTLCLLLMEVFQTVYADAWPYLAVVTPQTERTRNALRGMLYSVDGEGVVEDDCIYIIEDSDVDMGLLESVDRNMNRLLGIITDFLDWHTEMVNTPDPPETPPVDIMLPPEPKKGFFAKVKSFFRKIGIFFKKLFHIKGKDEKEPAEDEPGQDQAIDPKERRKAEKQTKREERKRKREEKKQKREERRREKAERRAAKKAGKKAGTAPTEDGLPGTEKDFGLPDDSAVQIKKDSGQIEDTAVEIKEGQHPDPEYVDNPASDDSGGDLSEEAPHVQAYISHADTYDEPPEAEGPPVETEIGGTDEQSAHVGIQNKYMRSCYLKFGFEQIDSAIAVEQTLNFLNELGFGDNELHQARKGDRAVEDHQDDIEEQCDFCGLPLNGVAYDVLGDGRVRCVSCSSSAIKTVDEFRDLYRRTLPSMEAFYDIRISVPIRVRSVDARTVNRQFGKVYKPTNRFDGRILGFARRDRNGYSIYLENGSPRLGTIETLTHELTHIWQYINWDEKAIRKKYGKGDVRDMLYEGMAMWASIQFLYLIGESDFARRKEAQTLKRQDVYGQGFRLYCEKYPLSHSATLPAHTPFHTDPPL